MNILFPRSNQVEYEISMLASPSEFYISYESSAPIFGEAQDSVIGAAQLTRSDVRINKFHAMNLFSNTDVYPDMNKYADWQVNERGQNLFSGRDMVSILLHEQKTKINFSKTPVFYKKEHSPYISYDPTEIKVKIENGRLKSGVLDKASIGEEKAGNMFHEIYHHSGSKQALRTSFNLQQVIIWFQEYRGFTAGIADVVISQKSQDSISEKESQLVEEAKEITEKLNRGEIIPLIGKTKKQQYEELQMNALKDADLFWESIFTDIDLDDNGIGSLIRFGSKGGWANFKVILSALGQTNITGERPRDNFNGRSLAYFPRFDKDPASRGFVRNSYMSGVNNVEFIFGSQESRVNMIKIALGTAVTGAQNRKSIKNLEPITIDNMRRSVKSGSVVQCMYGANGSDPRHIEKVRFKIGDKKLNRELFEKEFKMDIKKIPSKFQTGMKKIIDEEFDKLKKYREEFIKILLQIETSTGNKLYTNEQSMPVNVDRIIGNVVHELNLERKMNLKDPIGAYNKIQEFCDNLKYIYTNKIMKKKKAKLPEFMESALKFLKILIRSSLCLANITNKGVSDKALDVILRRIDLALTRSLVIYGKAMGIIAAQSYSHPATQTMLDSKHQAGIGAGGNKGFYRIEEILGAKPTERMLNPIMTLPVLPEYENNEVKVREIANHIEMLPLSRFVISKKIFFEEYGSPIHPEFVQEKKIISEFMKYNVNIKPPADLNRWCLRIELSKSQLILKQMKVITIYRKLRETFPYVFIVYTTDNADSIIMRIYFRNTISKKYTISKSKIIDIRNEMLKTVIRGVPGIYNTFVTKRMKNVIAEDGSIETKEIYQIETTGTNLRRILENPYLDLTRVKTNSIIETAEVFGIAAARNKISNELYYQYDGAAYQHYLVYADEMTFTGEVTSIDRYGNTKRDAEIMARMSDASQISVIEEAAMNSAKDGLTGVSACIMMGKNPRVGTLYNSIVLDEEFIKKNTKSTSSLIKDL